VAIRDGRHSQTRDCGHTAILQSAIRAPSVGITEVFMQKPTNGIRPEKVKAARKASGLTQAEAAPLVYTSIDNWQNWEQGRNVMARAIYELFLLKTGQILLVLERAGLWSTS
jgi:DNA-binding transcriptional regulator YiaG